MDLGPLIRSRLILCYSEQAYAMPVAIFFSVTKWVPMLSPLIGLSTTIGVRLGGPISKYVLHCPSYSLGRIILSSAWIQ